MLIPTNTSSIEKQQTRDRLRPTKKTAVALGLISAELIVGGVGLNARHKGVPSGDFPEMIAALSVDYFSPAQRAEINTSASHAADTIATSIVDAYARDAGNVLGTWGIKRGENSYTYQAVNENGVLSYWISCNSSNGSKNVAVTFSPVKKGENANVFDDMALREVKVWDESGDETKYIDLKMPLSERDTAGVAYWNYTPDKIIEEQSNQVGYQSMPFPDANLATQNIAMHAMEMADQVVELSRTSRLT